MENLKALGSGSTQYRYDRPSLEILEKFPNPMPNSGNNHSKVEIVAPEFTSLCPITNQPDFATIRVIYTPNLHCVESKSFKLYLGAFRQEGMFHEACVAKIAEDLWSLLEPLSLEVIGEFSPRGGISFWPRVVKYGTI